MSEACANGGEFASKAAELLQLNQLSSAPSFGQQPYNGGPSQGAMRDDYLFDREQDRTLHLNGLHR